ncbi:hypothetical protein I2484_18360, partial [Sporosarcina sp. E16_8]|nr:hypothetical protein [Sporosarcina sp. E16_8]
MDLQEGKYENRLVAFIDILGFSALVQKSESDTLYAEKLYKALDNVQEAVKQNEIKQSTENSALEMAQFSDSLVVSLPYTNSASFFSFVMKLNLIQKTLADEGILIRGGVSAGKLYHKGSISYGPAFIRAYNIENGLADYPRIVIDPQIINLKLLPENEDLEDSIFQMGFHNFEGNRNPIVLKDVDSLYYINYLYGMYEEEEIVLMLHSKVQLLTGLSVQGLMAILSIRVYRKEKR